MLNTLPYFALLCFTTHASIIFPDIRPLSPTSSDFFGKVNCFEDEVLGHHTSAAQPGGVCVVDALVSTTSLEPDEGRSGWLLTSTSIFAGSKKGFMEVSSADEKPLQPIKPAKLTGCIKQDYAIVTVSTRKLTVLTSQTTDSVILTLPKTAQHLPHWPKRLQHNRLDPILLLQRPDLAPRKRNKQHPERAQRRHWLPRA